MTEDTPVAAQAGERAGHPVLTDATFLGAVALGLYLLGKCYVAARYSLTTATALLTASPMHTDDVVGRQLCHLGASQPRARRPLWYVVVGQPYQSPNQLCRRVVKQIPGQRVMAGSLPSR
jgi:hypothetical protein